MEKTFDCLIIGGGVIGCSIARELSRYDLKIAVLEKSEDICNGQSKANTGIVHAGYDAKPGTLKAFYNVKGNGMFDQLCAELDVPFKRNSSLVISFDENDREILNDLLIRGRKNGVPDLSLLNREETLRREPSLNPNVTGALLAESAGIVCPYELTIAYAENAANNGVLFFRDHPVTHLEREGNIWRVFCDHESFLTRSVINCAGIYSDVINNMVSSEKFHIQARRGEYCLIDKRYADTFHASIFQPPTVMGKGIMVAVTVDGTILLGPTAEDIRDKDDTMTTPFGLDQVLEGAAKTWPGFPKKAIITQFSGVRAHPEGGDFIIGPAKDAPGFFNAAGIESPGLTSAPAIALDVAEMAADYLHADINTHFDPIRKGIPKFRELSNSKRAELIREDNNYAKIVCRCEMVTEAEIREAIRRPVGAVTMDGIKRRTRAGMGRCQSGFCTTRVMQILSEELNIPQEAIRKAGPGSELILEPLFSGKKGGKA